MGWAVKREPIVGDHLRCGKSEHSSSFSRSFYHSCVFWVGRNWFYYSYEYKRNADNFLRLECGESDFLDLRTGYALFLFFTKNHGIYFVFYFYLRFRVGGQNSNIK